MSLAIISASEVGIFADVAGYTGLIGRRRYNGIYQGLVRGVRLPVSAACRRYSVQSFSFNAHPEIRRDSERTIVLDPGWNGTDGKYRLS